MTFVSTFTERSRIPLWGWGLVALLLLALPFGLNDFWTRIAFGALLWIGLAESWNMIGGYAGYLDFGHGAYFGLGAFATGIAMVQYSLPFLAGFVVAALAGVVLSYLVAIPTLRLKGSYFAIATWALAEALKQLALILNISGGTYGMSLPTSASSFGLPLPGGTSETFFYYAVLVMTALTIVLAYAVFEQSEFGFRVKALRDDEDAAESLGIDTTRTKRQVYVLSCVVASLFGSLFAYHVTFIHPNAVLAGTITDRMVIMALLGGLGTVTGPIIGGLGVFLLQRLSGLFLGTSTIYLPLIGLLIMGVVLFAPSGVVGLVTGEVSGTDIRNNVSELLEKFDLL